MAITATERTQIVELVVLMFNAAPGATYLSQVVAAYEADGHNLQTLAVQLAATPAYQALNPNFQLAADFAAAFLTPLGLQTDSVAVAFVTSKFNAGESKGQIAFEAFTALNGVTSAYGPQYQNAKAILLNKTAVAEYYSETLQVGETNLSTLQTVLASVTADPASVATAEAGLLAAQTNTTIFLKAGQDIVSNAGTVVGDLSPFLFNGTGPTLNYNDSITNVVNLNVVDQFGTGVDIIPAGATLSNIQNISLNTAGNAGQGSGAPFDTSGISGVKTLTVTSAGSNIDFLNAAETTNVTVLQKNEFGGVNATGGNNVTVDSSGSQGVLVGANALGVVPNTGDQASGNVTITERSSAGGDINVFGGKAVAINVTNKSYTGAIDIGNTANNTGNDPNGGAMNPTGAISVNSVANGGSGAIGDINIFGGTTVSVTGAGGSIFVGDFTDSVDSNMPTGAVTIVDKQAKAFNDITNSNGGTVEVFGGTDVSVTTNTGGSVYIGNPEGAAVTLPTGNITVVDQGGAFDDAFAMENPFSGNWQGDIIAGGKNVSVTADGAFVYIGAFADNWWNNSDTTVAANNPTGTVTVNETHQSHTEVRIDGGLGINVTGMGQRIDIGTQTGAGGDVIVNQAVTPGTDAFTGHSMGTGVTNWLSRVEVDGGANVTINTSGGNVHVGNDKVANGTAQAPTGAVSITDTFSGAGSANDDHITVLGGTTVNLTVTHGTDRDINVGEAATLDSFGKLTNASQIASGNVTIVNGNGDLIHSSLYGNTNVYTNGSQTVSITGSHSVFVQDVQTTSYLSNPIGTSTLSTVNLQDVGWNVDLVSDALTSVSLTRSTNFITPSDVTINNANKHALSVTLNNTKSTSWIEDATATSATIGTAGTAKDGINLNMGAATALNFTNSAALTLGSVTIAAGALGSNTITASGSGSLNLGDLSNTGWTGGIEVGLVDASKATGAVTAHINGTVTAFTGGAGNDVITVDALVAPGSKVAQLATKVDGGAGTNEVIITNTADTYNPLLNNKTAPIFGDFTNFQVLGLGAGTNDGANGGYNVSGFSDVQIIGNNSATLTLNGAGATETLTIAAAHAGDEVDWVSTSATINLGTASSKGFDSGIVKTGTATGSATTVTLNANGSGTQLLTLTDTGGKGGTTTVAINGTASLTLTDTDKTITTINASGSSGKVNLITGSGVEGAATGMTVTGGSGALSVNFLLNGANTVDTVDVLTTGSGGATATIGAGNAQVGKGSETFNLGASSAVRDTLIANTAPTAGNGTRAVINGFGFGTVGAVAAGDVIQFQAPKTVVANAVGLVGTYGTYSVTNGVYTITTVVGTPTGTQELSDIVGFVDAASTAATVAEVGMVQIAGSTYVVAASGGFTAPEATELQLTGVTGVTGFGTSKVDGLSGGAGSTVMLDPTNLLQIANGGAGNGGSTVTSTTYNDQGFAVDTLTVGKAGITNTYSNMANWAMLDVSNATAGNVVVTQQGTAPKFLVVQAENSYTLDSLTYDGALQIDSQFGSSHIKSLVNATNTDATIWVTGANATEIDKITDTALTKIDASKATGDSANLQLGTSTGALTQTGLTIMGTQGTSGSGAVGAINTIYASGAGDIITGNVAKFGGWTYFNGDTIVANGAGDTITVGAGANDITASGAGTKITINASSAQTWNESNEFVHASGAGDTIVINDTATDLTPVHQIGDIEIDGGTSSIGIGKNTSVTFSTAFDTGWGFHQNVVVTGATAGATSAGAFSMITLNNVDFGLGEHLVFNNAATEIWAGQANVANASSLAQALDIAVNTAAMSQQGADGTAGVIGAHTGVLDWFQYGGNTYIVEAVNGAAAGAAHAALATGDEVIKITGIVDLDGINSFSGHNLFV